MKHKHTPLSPLSLSLLFLLFLITMVNTGWCVKPLEGPLPDRQKAIIHFMSEHHSELHREVTLLDNGYEAITTTQNKELATQLTEHFSYMEKRLAGGAKVRCWDPAFSELVRYYDQLSTQLEYLDNGIKVTVIGHTPEAVQIAHNHARIVTGFTQKGFEAVRQKHAPVLNEQTHPKKFHKNRPTKPPFKK